MLIGTVQQNGTHLQGMEFVMIVYRFRTDGNYKDRAQTWVSYMSLLYSLIDAIF